MTSRVCCARCDLFSKAHIWGFALMVAEGWSYRKNARSGDAGWLCARCAEQAPGTEAEEGSGVVRCLRVLVVDDEELVLRATRRLLEQADLSAHRLDSAGGSYGDGELNISAFQVTTALGSQRALELIACNHFDVVISDVSMPGMRGPDLFYASSLRWPEVSRKFLFVSGNPAAALPEIRSAARRSGSGSIPPLLEKTNLHQTLIPAIFELLSQRAARSGMYALPLAQETRYELAK